MNALRAEIQRTGSRSEVRVWKQLQFNKKLSCRRKVSRRSASLKILLPLKIHSMSLAFTPVSRTCVCYEFLLVFHCNYGAILHRFQDKARYWSKIATFLIPPSAQQPTWEKQMRVFFAFCTIEPARSLTHHVV